MKRVCCIFLLCALTGFGQGRNPNIQATGTRKIASSFTPTVTASSAYASGNEVGQVLTFTNAVTGPGGSATIASITITDKSTQSGTYDLWLFKANPSNGTYTDKVNVTINATDLGFFIGNLSVGTWSVATTGGGVATITPNLPIKLASGVTTLYGILITRSTPTYATTSALTLTLMLLED